MLSKNVKIAVEVYDKLRRGDPIKDGELKIAIALFQLHVEIVAALPREFKLYADQLRHDLLILEGYALARGFKCETNVQMSEDT
jgi:hypothetical protein